MYLCFCSGLPQQLLWSLVFFVQNSVLIAQHAVILRSVHFFVFWKAKKGCVQVQHCSKGPELPGLSQGL